MPIYPISNNNIVEVNIRQRQNGQEIINTLHYAMSLGVTVGDGAALVDQLLDTLTLGDTSLLAALNATQTNEIHTFQVDGQLVYTTRYAKRSKLLNHPGSISNQALPQNCAVTLLKRTGFATQRKLKKHKGATGSFHIAGMPFNTNQGGLVNFAAYGDALETLCDHLATVVDLGSGKKAIPCLWHRYYTGEDLWWTQIESVFAQDEIRVERRRTVGLGI